MAASMAISGKRRLGLTVAAGVLALLPMGITVALGAGATFLLPAPLSGPMRTLKLATLDLPQPVGAMPEGAELPALSPASAMAEPLATATIGPDLPEPAAYIDPADIATGQVCRMPASATAEQTDGLPFPPDEENTDFIIDAGAPPDEWQWLRDETSARARLELALDLLLELPAIRGDEVTFAAPSGIGGNLDGIDADSVVLPAEPEFLPGEAASDDPNAGNTLAGMSAAEAGAAAFRYDSAIVFSRDPRQFPPLEFETGALADHGLVPQPLQPPTPMPQLVPTMTREASLERAGIWPSPAQRLALAGPALARAQKCLAEAIYFESRGEPRRGQIAVAQVVVNRVFSGYYPADICGTVYQNAHRRLACQFTFACDNVKDVIREPDMWMQAKEIAADMLDGKLWLDSVGRATHYHAFWVRPKWVREMNRLDRIGVHTFYRPRRWQG